MWIPLAIWIPSDSKHSIDSIDVCFGAASRCCIQSPPDFRAVARFLTGFRSLNLRRVKGKEPKGPKAPRLGLGPSECCCVDNAVCGELVGTRIWLCGHGTAVAVDEAV